MNLDDFLVPNSIASPAGIAPSPEERSSMAEHSRGHGMPIQSRKPPNYQPTEPLPVSSVPPPVSSVPPPSITSNHTGEFDYVQRRVRKTSIDESRVSQVLRDATLHLQKLIASTASKTSCRILSSCPTDNAVESQPRWRWRC